MKRPPTCDGGHVGAFDWLRGVFGVACRKNGASLANASDTDSIVRFNEVCGHTSNNITGHYRVRRLHPQHATSAAAIVRVSGKCSVSFFSFRCKGLTD